MTNHVQSLGASQHTAIYNEDFIFMKYFFAKLSNNSSTNVKLTFLTFFIMFLQNLLHNFFLLRLSSILLYTPYNTPQNQTLLHTSTYKNFTNQQLNILYLSEIHQSSTPLKGQSMLPHISK